MKKPPIHTSPSGTQSVEVIDIINSEVGWAEIEKFRDADLTHAGLLDKLTKLREATNQICKRAHRRRTEIMGAVNWADLHCIDAEYRLSDDGTSYFAVSVEEASPDAHNLALFIQEELKRAGFPDVHVETEW